MPTTVPIENSRRFTRSTFGIAILLALSMGVVDVSLSVLKKPSGFASWPAVYPPMIATATFFLALYGALWLGAGQPLARAFGLDRWSASLSLALWLASAFTLASLTALLRWPLEPAELFELLVVIALSSVTAVAGYLALGRLRPDVPDVPYSMDTLVLAIPFLLFQILVFEWSQLYVIDSVLSPSSVVVSIAALAIAAITLLAFFRHPTKAAIALGVLIAASALLPLGYARAARTVHGEAPALEQGVRQVVLVTADALRADALSCYNDDSVATPNLDALANDGVLFERPKSAAPWTLASLASILSGLSPTVHSLTEIKSRLPDSPATLAERMQRSGYHTGAVVLNDLLHPEANLSQGFADYVFLTEPFFAGSLGARLLQFLLPAAFPSAPWPSSEDITEIALDWLSRNRERSFFLWIHYYDPHAPYTPPARYLPDIDPPPGVDSTFYDQRGVTAGFSVPSRVQRQWIETLYKGEVRYLDDNIGSLVRGLEDLGIYDDALIVFTSDHGEEFWEHGAHGHGHSLYDEVLSVPLIFKLPGARRRGRVAANVATESVTPTILELCEIHYEPERFSSSSLAPLFSTSSEELGAVPVVSTAQVLFDKQESVVFGSKKYVRSMIGDEEAFFDLETDPREQNPLLPSAADEYFAQARHLLEDHHARSKALRGHYAIEGREEISFDEETTRRLKALGYVQ